MYKIEIIRPLKPNQFVWYIEIEHGTILETCAIDALMFVHKRHGDYWTYATYDKDTWIEFERYRIARQKRINKEFMSRYA